MPTVALALLLSMALRVWSSTDAWPVRNQPDPKDLGLHNSLTVVAILGSFAAVLVVPLLSLLGVAVGWRRPSARPIVVGLIGAVALYGVLWLDIGGLGEWIGD